MWAGGGLAGATLGTLVCEHREHPAANANAAAPSCVAFGRGFRDDMKRGWGWGGPSLQATSPHHASSPVKHVCLTDSPFQGSDPFAADAVSQTPSADARARGRVR